MATNHRFDADQAFEKSLPDFSWKQFEAFSIPKSHLDLLFDQQLPPGADSILVQEDLSKWKREAETGSSEAQFYLGKCYEEGIGVRQSFKEALRYYQLAADQGLAEAQVRLGLLFAKGRGATQSDSLAFHYYTLAGNQGNCVALTLIRECYEKGKGVEKSIDTAIEYYEIAKYEEDHPQILEKKHLEESTELPRKENLERAHKIYITLPQNEIKYPGSEELDITPYLEDKKLEILRKIFENSKDRPIYLILSEASYDEMVVIRDAMIANPRFTFFCLRRNSFSLWDAFHRAGYKPHRVLKKKIAKFNERTFTGFVFKGG